MKKINTIACPNCGHDIQIEEVLSHRLREEFQADYQQKIAKYSKDYERKLKELENQENLIKEKQESIKEQVEQQLNAQLKKEKKELESKIRNSITEENQEIINSLREELDLKTKAAKELNKLKIENDRIKREQEEMREKIELEHARKYREMLDSEKEKIRKSESEAISLKMQDKEKLINDLKKQLTEAQRKAEQGSMQLQGEVLELAIEDFLRTQYPMDEISEIKKGEKGADVVHKVKHHGRDMGIIYYESKRTKSFNKNWLEKFKNDMIEKGADVGILVTEAMPDGVEHASVLNGIWVCSFKELPIITSILREKLIDLKNALETSKNTGSKMGMLYDYLTSNEFKMQIEEIVNGFVELKSQIDTEKRAMERQWKSREKQLERIILNTTRFYGSVKGIAGKSIPDVAALELPGE